MHKITRNYILTGLVCTLVAAGLIGYVWNENTLSDMRLMTEKQGRILKQHFVNRHWEILYPWVSELDKLRVEQLGEFTAVKEFGSVLRSEYSKLDMLDANIYALNGNTVFSTQQRQLGVIRDADPDFQRARSGKTVVRYQHHDKINSMEGIVLNKYTMIMISPIVREGRKEVDAVLEVHFDVSTVMAEHDRNIPAIYGFIVLVVLAVFSILLLFIHKMDNLLTGREADVRKLNKKISHQKSHDSLTGLPDREVFYEKLTNRMEGVEDREMLLGVLNLELGRFKKINDTLGFQVGDKLLQEASQRIRHCLRTGDMVSRHGSFDFVIMLNDFHVIDEAESIAEMILRELSARFEIENYELFLLPSIGISIHPFVDDDAHSLIRKASTAMYKAKKSGRNTLMFYSPTISQKASSLFSLENSLRHALERNEFEIHYQPIVLAKTGKVFAVESLIRWHSPEVGMVTPDDFIPLLEDTGLIVQVGRWALETACHQGVKWHNMGMTDLKINVNVSAVQFLQREIVRQVSDVLDNTGIKPHLLDLEITESLLIDNVSHTIDTLEKLNEFGVSLSIDDFGTGYSSLEYLKQLPVDTLKIDSSFIRDVVDNADDAAIVNAICGMAHNMRFKIIAEGIETTGQLNFLRKLNVTGIQGYLFCRPQPAEELTDFLMRDSLQNYQGPAA